MGSNLGRYLNKIQMGIVGVIILGVFLPVVTAKSSYNSAGVSFFDAKDGKIILGLLVVALVLLFLQNNKKSIGIKIGSLVFIVLASLIFFLNMDKVSGIKSFLATVHYGIGYYLMLIGFILGYIVGLVNIFVKGNDEPVSNFIPSNMNNNFNPNQMPFNNYNNMNNNQMNNNFNNMNNNQMNNNLNNMNNNQMNNNFNNANNSYNPNNNNMNH